MSESTIGSLIESMLQCLPVTREQVEECRSKLEAAEREPTEQEVVGELCRRGVITEWQFQQLRNGFEEFVLEEDRYLLLDQIGQGGMGAVYKARHMRMNRIVALKVIDPKRVTDKRLIDRFRREVEVCSRLQHEHIVQASDVGKHKGTTFLVLEYVEGSNLAALVQRDGIMPADEAAAICLQSSAALSYAHRQGIIHRDIKPSNILLSTEGVTKILDLGLARIEQGVPDRTQTELTHEGAVMGTIDYMAPEQAREVHSADHRSDLYSLGATLYFLLTGRPPFPGGSAIEKLHRLANEEPEPVNQIRPDCPIDLADVVHRLMEKDPNRRYESAEDVVRALQPFAASRIAGRPVVTAAVQSAADTQRDQTVQATIEGPRALFAEETAGTVRSLVRRPNESKKLLWWAVALALIVSVALGLMFRGEAKDGRKVENGDTPNRQKPIPSTAAKAPNQPPTEYRVELSGHYNYVYGLAWSPDGTMLASAGDDGFVRVWRVSTTKPISVYRGHRSWPIAVVWSADGKSLASVDHHDQIHIWNAETAKSIAVIQRQSRFRNSYPGTGTYGMAFSPNGREFAYCDANEVIRWNRTRKQRSKISATCCSLTYSPDSRLLAGAGFDGTLNVWDVQSGKPIIQMVADGKPKVPHFHTDGTLLIAEGQRISVWDCKQNKRMREFRIPRCQMLPYKYTKTYHRPNLQFSDTGELVVLQTDDGLLLVETNSEKTHKLKATIPDRLSTSTFAPKLGLVACAMPYGAGEMGIHLLRTDSGARLGLFGIVGIRAKTPAIVSNTILGSSIVATRGNQVWLLNTADTVERAPAEIHVGTHSRVRSLEDDRVLLWPGGLAAGRKSVLRRLPGAREYLAESARHKVLHWCADGSAIYGVSKDFQRICFWNSKTGNVVRIVETRKHSAEWLRENMPAISADASVLAIPGSDNKIRVWRGDMKSPTKDIAISNGQHCFVALSSDGERLAYAAHAGSFEIWDAESGRRIGDAKTGLNHYLRRRFLKFSLAGRYLFVSRQVWDAKEIRKIWECPEPDHEVGGSQNHVTQFGGVFPDERHVVIGQDATFQIWDFKQNKKRATIFHLPKREWVFVNHETGHWKGSDFGFQYLRLKLTSESGKSTWVTPDAYERASGWKSDPTKAGLSFEAKPDDKLPK